MMKACPADARPPRSNVGPLSLILCVAGFIAFLTLRHGVETATGLRLFGAVYFLFVIPGFVVSRIVFRIRPDTPFESLVLSFLVGVLVTPIVWYGLNWLGCEVAFAPMVIGLGLIVPIALRWYRCGLHKIQDLIPRRDAPVLWLALLIAVIWSWQIEPIDVIGDQVFIRVHSEHSMHASMVEELSRGVPAEAFPFLVGASTWAYHDMPDVWCDLLRRTVGDDPQTVYFFVALPLRYIMLALGCYLMLVPRFGRAGGLLSAACMFLIVEPGTFSENWGWLSYIHFNFGTTFGLIGVFTIGFLASRTGQVGMRGALLLAAILSGMLLWYKANFALAVGPAVAILCTLILVRCRDYRWLALCIASQLVLVAIRMVQLDAAELRMPMTVAPLVFLQWWWDALAIPPDFIGGARSLIATWPALLRWPSILLICLVSAFPLGILAVLYAVIRCGLFRRRPVVRPFDMFLGITLLCCVLGFVAFPIQPALVSNVSVPIWTLCGILLFCLVGPVVHDVLHRTWRSGKSTTIVVLLATVLAGAVNAFALRRAALWVPHSYSAVVSKDFYACCRFLAEEAPQDAVTLHSRYAEPLFVSMLSQRRSVFEFGWAWSMFTDTRSLKADLDEFFEGADSQRARQIAQRYQVDYVLAEDSARLAALAPSPLNEVFRSGKTVVYEMTKLNRILTTTWSDDDLDTAH